MRQKCQIWAVSFLFFAFFQAEAFENPNVCESFVNAISKSERLGSPKDLHKKVVGVTAGSLKVIDFVERSEGDYFLIRQGPGYISNLYDNAPLMVFVKAYPHLAHEIGIRILSERFEKDPEDPNSEKLIERIYEFPAPETANKNLRALRRKGMLPENGFEFLMVGGKIPDNDYFHLLRQQILPMGTGEIFFHDIHAHFISSILLFEDIAKTVVDDLRFSTVGLPSMVDAAPWLKSEIEENISSFSQAFDSGSAVNPSFGFRFHSDVLSLAGARHGTLKALLRYTPSSLEGTLEQLVSEYRVYNNTNYYKKYKEKLAKDLNRAEQALSSNDNETSPAQKTN